MLACMVCRKHCSTIAAETRKDNDQGFRGLSDSGPGSCVDWFQSKPVKTNLFHWAPVRKQPKEQLFCWGFFCVTSCYILYFLNGKSPRLRAYVFCSISKLRLRKSLQNFSVVLSSFKIMILRMYSAGFPSVKGTEFWKSSAVRADRTVGHLPIDVCCFPLSLTALEILTVAVAQWFSKYLPLCLFEMLLSGWWSFRNLQFLASLVCNN